MERSRLNFMLLAALVAYCATIFGAAVHQSVHSVARHASTAHASDATVSDSHCSICDAVSLSSSVVSAPSYRLAIVHAVAPFAASSPATAPLALTLGSNQARAPPALSFV